MKFFLFYLLIVNAAGFLIMLVDKQTARKNMWRISEASLFTIALIGGSIGCLAGMYLCRHKTRHWTFVIGMPLILFFQFLLLVSYAA